jgi:hypothetical protein
MAKTREVGLGLIVNADERKQAQITESTGEQIRERETKWAEDIQAAEEANAQHLTSQQEYQDRLANIQQRAMDDESQMLERGKLEWVGYQKQVHHAIELHIADLMDQAAVASKTMTKYEAAAASLRREHPGESPDVLMTQMAATDRAIQDADLRQRGRESAINMANRVGGITGKQADILRMKLANPQASDSMIQNMAELGRLERALTPTSQAPATSQYQQGFVDVKSLDMNWRPNTDTILTQIFTLLQAMQTIQ